MSKRFYSFGSTEPAKKKNSSGFVPWNQQDFIPQEVKNGDIKAGLLYLMNLSSTNLVPKVAFKHQLYSVVENRTTVDRGINALLEKGEIKLFKTSLGTEQLVIMFTKDYISHVKIVCSVKDAGTSTKVVSGVGAHTSDNDQVIGNIASRFVDTVLPNLKDISINEDLLVKQYGFKDEEVTEMIKCGILTVKNAGTWWLSIPNIGAFMKLLRKGRQAVMQTIKRTKYREMARATLLTKKTIPSLKLNIEYHLHDLIGADLVKPIKSTTGILLRLDET